MLLPLIDFERAIASLAKEGYPKLAVPDRGLIVGTSLDEASDRLKKLSQFARRKGVVLYVYNATEQDVRTPTHGVRTVPPA